MNLLLVTLFIGQLTITGYRSEPRFTDDSPFITATGERVSPDGVAISQDLLIKNGGPLNFGDWLWIDGVGLKRINDTMAKRHRNAIDIWCPTKAHETKIWQQFKGRKTRVWVIHRAIKGE